EADVDGVDLGVVDRIVQVGGRFGAELRGKLRGALAIATADRFDPDPVAECSVVRRVRLPHEAGAEERDGDQRASGKTCFGRLPCPSGRSRASEGARQRHPRRARPGTARPAPLVWLIPGLSKNENTKAQLKRLGLKGPGASAKGIARFPAVAVLEPVVHLLHVAQEVHDRLRRPAEELLALLRRRLARRAPDAATLLEERPERAGRRLEERVEQRERARTQLAQVR